MVLSKYWNFYIYSFDSVIPAKAGIQFLFGLVRLSGCRIESGMTRELWTLELQKYKANYVEYLRKNKKC